MTDGTPTRIYPDCGYDYSDGRVTLPQRAAAFYAAGAHGLQVMQGGVRGTRGSREEFQTPRALAVTRRLGHVDELTHADQWQAETAHPVELKKVAGLRLDPLHGTPTCG